MTITDYLINALFVLVVIRQARERELDLRSLLIPLVLVAFVAHNYLHSIPAKTHVNRIFYKIGARDRAQAVRYAYEHGIA